MHRVVEGVPPGLSQTLVNQVTDGHFLESDQLEKVRFGINLTDVHVCRLTCTVTCTVYVVHVLHVTTLV